MAGLEVRAFWIPQPLALTPQTWYQKSEVDGGRPLGVGNWMAEGKTMYLVPEKTPDSPSPVFGGLR